MQHLRLVMEKAIDTTTYDPNESKDCKECFGVGLVRVTGKDPITKLKISYAKACECEKGKPYRLAHSKANNKA
ncbi:MAG: hypothetical protein WAQ98_21455 [Blastocatellia bacterium]